MAQRRNWISNATDALVSYVEVHGEIVGNSQKEVAEKIYKVIKPAIVRGSQKSGFEATILAESFISKILSRRPNSSGIRMVPVNSGKDTVKLVVD